MLDTAAPTGKSDSGESFIRQSFERGHLQPALLAPSRNCSVCGKRFRGNHQACFRCRKSNYAKAAEKPMVNDSYLDTCGICQARTLHLGPRWCVDCHAVPGAAFEIYCEGCELEFEVPAAVKNDCGGVVDMFKTDSLWCVKCEGLADSWMRLDENGR